MQMILLLIAATFGQRADTAQPPYTIRDTIFPAGEVRLSGRLYAPRGLSRYPVVVMVTGSGDVSVIDEPYTRVVAGAFAAAGIGALAYDKRGTGRSTGAPTGTDVQALGRDAAAAILFARRLPGVSAVGLWGISQAGWVVPYTLQKVKGVAFAILVSPAGVNPNEQVTFFLHRWMRGRGLTEAEADQADSMHLATVRYYASGRGYAAAQAQVDRFKNEPWFHRVVTDRYWDNMASEGQLYTPTQLADRVARHPGEFELLRSASSFVDYGRLYESLTLPTLVIYGSEDDLLPIDRSRTVIDAALRRRGSVAYEFRVFKGATHDIQTPDEQVRADYLELLTNWARARFTRR